MALYKYNKYKILISPDSKKIQGLQVGDVVRRQYYDNPDMIYSLMVVLDTGTDVISGKDAHYFIGALLEGNEPKTGELLDFVRITSLLDYDRTGALYLTAADTGAPFMDIIDGMGVDNSLCLPIMKDGDSQIPDKRKYACFGSEYINIDYLPFDNGHQRILTITRNEVQSNNISFGLSQAIGLVLTNPMRILVSFKIRAFSKLSNVRIQLGYTNGVEIDGFELISIGTEWEYKLCVITIDYPSQYQRSFSIDLTQHLPQENTYCQIADLNIILQSEISTLSNGVKARVGKLKGIVDPIFGTLEGYGAYFQNMYATKNVNIAGTLTAGDEKGFSSTFYVGKIHKNVILDSTTCHFEGSDVLFIEDEPTPVGIGRICQLSIDSNLKAQTAEWRNTHVNQEYCFSIWMKASEDSAIRIYQDKYLICSINIEADKGWQRYHESFLIQDTDSPFLNIRIESSTILVQACAPQLEAGVHPGQYQPTDGTLSFVEDYGAWFSKGGIGGTIQNPLLKLNDDGSISSRDNSFVIHSDGTGYFADGRFKWSKDTITLSDVAIQWEDLSSELKENLSPITIHIISNTGFTITSNSADIQATAKLYQNGKELDAQGVAYTYIWSLWDKAGTSVIQTIYGKTIKVKKTQVEDRAVLSCEVSQDN